LWKLADNALDPRALPELLSCKGVSMSYDEALAWASRDEAFKASLYAMNTLLIHKGIYSKEEFEALFVEWVAKEQRRRQRETKPARAKLSA
jgi:hypothetical protein